MLSDNLIHNFASFWESLPERGRCCLRKLLWALLVFFLLSAAGAVYFFLTAGSGYLTGPLISAAQKAEASEHPALAERLYRKVLDLNDCDVRARTLLADLYESQGRTSAAEALLKKGIEIFPSGADLYLRLAALYIRTGRADEASAVLDAADNPYVSIALSGKRPDVEAVLPGGHYPVGTVFSLEDRDGIRYFYQTDGEWTEYTEPIALDEGSRTVRVIAVDEDDVPSPIRTYNYTLLPKAQSTLSETGQIVRCPFCGETFRVP